MIFNSSETSGPLSNGRIIKMYSLEVYIKYASARTTLTRGEGSLWSMDISNGVAPRPTFLGITTLEEGECCFSPRSEKLDCESRFRLRDEKLDCLELHGELLVREHRFELREELDREHCFELYRAKQDCDLCFWLGNGGVIEESLLGLTSDEKLSELDVDKSGFLG